jgi:hypothetical protein
MIQNHPSQSRSASTTGYLWALPRLHAIAAHAEPAHKQFSVSWLANGRQLAIRRWRCAPRMVATQGEIRCASVPGWDSHLLRHLGLCTTDAERVESNRASLGALQLVQPKNLRS